MAYRSRTAPTDGRRPRPLVSVYVDYHTLTGRLLNWPAVCRSHPASCSRCFAEADIERIVFGPRNRVIELGVRERFFTGGLRHAIQLRDRHCQYPSCTEPAARCQVDHKLDYTLGGETTQDNGELLCGTHNRNKHRHPTEPDPVDARDRRGRETAEDIARQHRRCRQRIQELIRASGNPPKKRPPPFSRTIGAFTSPLIDP